MKSINIYLNERLRLNNDSRINDSQYGFSDIEELILNSTKIRKKIHETDSLLSDPSLTVSGSILYYNDKGINTGIEDKAFIFNINIKDGKREKFILLQDEDKIQAYHIIFGYKLTKDKILDFTQPNNDKLDVTNDANKFYVSNANQFANYIIQMVNELFKTNSLPKRIEKIKKYAELCKRYIIL